VIRLFGPTLSRRLGVARATAQARLDRLARRGVIASFAPRVDPEALGYGVTAFATLEIRQGNGQQVLDHLRAIPKVLKVHTITGQGDMLCRLVAGSNAALQEVIDRVNRARGDRPQRNGDRAGQPDPAPGAAAGGPRRDVIRTGVVLFPVYRGAGSRFGW
jgi:DNA-binding Lrp family transcriptional regulator